MTWTKVACISSAVISLDKSSRYFLISKNFKTLKKYNNSDFYALVVGDLANKIKEN